MLDYSLTGMPRNRTDSRSHILTSSQVASMLGVSKKTLDRMIKDGRLPEPTRQAANNWRYWTIQDVEELKQMLGAGG